MNVQTALTQAVAFHRNGQLDEAETIYRQVLAADPNQPNALNLLGSLEHQRGRHDAAIALIRRAVAASPAFPEAHNNLGSALWAVGELYEAAHSFLRALELKPDFAEASRNLARLTITFFELGDKLRGGGQSINAARCYRDALALRPDWPEALNNLGTALNDVGETAEAIACYRRSLELQPSARAHSNLLLYLHYLPDTDPRRVFEEHVAWSDRYAAAIPRAVHREPSASHRPLRVGYLSPDFREHSVAFFFEPLLAAHDRDVVETFCYADVARPDAVTERLRRHARRWRDIASLDDDAVAQQIAHDEIDVLIDLAGHTANNRLLVFARKPAPVQVSYLGYPDTTGLKTMDARLTDSFADPPGAGSDELSVERLVRLDPCAWCYRPPDDAPMLAPRDQNEPVTFGSFNALAKTNSRVIDAWAELLRRVPHSNLLFKAHVFVDPAARRDAAYMFEQRGIDPDRVELHGYVASLREHLSLYNRVDVALDTFPYAGTTTTCEALWMGVPVVALAGRTHAGRVGVSLLSNVGLPELIAPTPAEYVEKAATLAEDRARLRDLRATLRRRLQRSALMDAASLARRIESALRTLCG